MNAPVVMVWDRPVRVLHWSLVVTVTLSWISTLGRGLAAWHEPAGFAALGVVVLRVLWGFVGSQRARFRNFLKPAQVVIDYARLWRRGLEPRFLGHNPLGGWMVALLLLTVAGAAVTGILLITDRYWGSPMVSLLHEALAWLVVALVLLHVLGVLLTGRHHHENLVRAMFSGQKRLD